jgi:uncharacterized membrane protein
MLNIIFTLLTVLSLCVLTVLLNITTPSTAGPFGILAVFIFAYTLSLCMMTYFLFWSSRLISKLSIVLIAKKPFEILTLKSAYYYSTILAAIPILLIGLQSVGAVGVYEFILVTIFTSIGILYVSKRVH